MNTTSELNKFDYSLFFPENYGKKVENTAEKSLAPKSDAEALNTDQHAYDEAFNDLEIAFTHVKTLKQNGKLDQIVAIDILAPHLEKIAKYSSKGLKWMAKAVDFSLENLPCESLRADKKIKEIADYFGDFAQTYGHVAKVISAAAFLIKYNSTKKLETYLRQKTTLLRNLKEIKTRISNAPEKSSYFNNMESELTQKITNCETEILKINERLQTELAKLNEKIVETSLSAFIACLKLAKAGCKKGTRKYLSYLIWFLSTAADVLGTYKGFKKGWDNLTTRKKNRKELQRLNEEIASLEKRSGQLEEQNNGNAKVCKKAITLLNARKCFLQNVRMNENFKKLIVEGIEFISSLSSTLGAIGALFAVTTAIAGALSTFAIWIAVLGYLIKAISYLYENPIRFSPTEEEDKRARRDKVLAEIIHLRIDLKKLNLENLDIWENLRLSQIDHTLKSYEPTTYIDELPILANKIDEYVKARRENLEKISQKDTELNNTVIFYKNQYGTDLFEPPEKKKIVIDEEEEEDHNEGSLIFNVGNEKENINDKELKKINTQRKELLAEQIELRGSADEYDAWANDIMENMKDTTYRNIISRILTNVSLESNDKVDLHDDSLQAFNQIENFIRR